MNPFWQSFIREMQSLREKQTHSRVVPEATDEISAFLQSFDFQTPLPLPQLADEMDSALRKWNVQVPHPGYFGLYNPATTDAAVLADTLVALYNPQLAAWSHAPLANAMEQYTLRFFLRTMDFPDESVANFTAGGSEANLTGVLVALARKFPAYLTDGLRALPRQPVFYVSEASHNSFDKIAKNIGLGRNALRVIETDTQFRMKPNALQQTITHDRASGMEPFLIVGTVGTTSHGAVDSLPDLRAIADEFGVWLHADAAWGGAAILSHKLRIHVAGITLADSVTIDAHKWFSVPMGAGMFFCRHPQAVTDAFSSPAVYMPSNQSHDPYVSTLQWSRRCIGLKLFMSLAHLGEAGYARQMERQAALTDRMAEKLRQNEWTIVHHSPLALVCFTHPLIQSGKISSEAVLQAVYADGRYWISKIRLKSGEEVFRACVTSYQTTETHVDGLVALVTEIVRR